MARLPLARKPRKPTPPWMQGAKEIKGHEMLVVHMSNTELRALDNLQGGSIIDPETGMREYSMIAHVVERKTVQDIFRNVKKEIETEKISPFVKTAHREYEEFGLPYSPTEEEKHNPLKSIEHLGRHGDTKMAIVPLEFVFMLLDIGRKPSINPTTGLLEFFGVGGVNGTQAAQLIPLAISAYMKYQGAQQEYEEEKQNMEQHNAKNQEISRAGGFQDTWRTPRPVEREYNNNGFLGASANERRHGITGSAFTDKEHFMSPVTKYYATGGLIKSYSKGTLVKGKGKGQDDTIKTSVPDGSYIIDASSTSMLGDGSSSAGADILKEFENKIKSKFPKHFTKNVEQEVKKNVKQVPVWLSNDEYKFDPLTVTLLGKGSNEKGAAFLKQMVINLRKHKISKGHGLPPKAKDISSYIPNRSH